MHWVGFEPTVPASERAKTVHALDRSTVNGNHRCKNLKFYNVNNSLNVAASEML
jgi:hypothetical protein